MPVDPSALLFDLDGTLLDTPRAIAEQFSAAVETVTGTHPGVEATRRLIGLPLEQMAGTLSRTESDSAVAATVAAEYLGRYRELIVPKAADLLFPGVTAGLAELTAAGLVPAVVTSKKHHSAELILEASGIRDYFGVVIGVDDVEHPKPHRASADAALASIGLTDVGPAGAVIGDTAGDIELGRVIGAFTIGVDFGVYSTDQITATSPDVIAHTFDDVTHAVLRRLEALPSDRK